MSLVTSKHFGNTQEGEPVLIFTISNNAGTSVSLIEYGCAITSVKLLNGRDVVLGYPCLSGYERTNCGMGSVIGRYANRIENAQYTIDNLTYKLVNNEGKNHLHGVFAKKVFTGKIDGESVIFSYISKDGEDGFGGELELKVKYSLSEDNELIINYEAKTSKATVINITNHSYFNLNGDGKNALNHTLMLNAKTFCESNDVSCPTGIILQVKNTPMDFTTPKKIGQDINDKYYQLQQAKGYDHNFIIDKQPKSLELCAKAISNDEQVIMQAYTTQPGVQLYTANFLGDEDICGKHGANYNDYSAFCLETQHYPASPSHPEFPSTVLKPGEIFSETTIYKFILGEK